MKSPRRVAGAWGIEDAAWAVKDRRLAPLGSDQQPPANQAARKSKMFWT